MVRKFLLSVCMILAGCSSSHNPPLETVPFLDIQKYMGRWYEIASFPAWFQQDCTGTTATYALNPDGSVQVVNKCYKSSLTGPEDTAIGNATIADTKTNAKLKVSFFWPFYGDYWVIDLAPDYSYAVVGHPNRDYLWILSRVPTMDARIYESILKKIQAKGFDVTRLRKTEQPTVY